MKDDELQEEKLLLTALEERNIKHSCNCTKAMERAY
jgi:hypothetical protein